MNQFLYTTAAIALLIAGGSGVQAQSASSVTRSASSVSNSEVSLLNQIGSVEVERAILLSKLRTDASMIQELDRQYVSLLGQLKQLQPRRYQALVASAAQTALSQKLGELEVERAIELTRFRADTPVIERFDRQLLSLMARLKELQPKQYRSIATSATQRTLEAKIAALQTVYRQEDQRLIASAPSQRALQAQISALNQRLAEIRKSVQF
ncbi:hypothetical protein ACQ4M3_39375 [Leptolyngbya sp. AN03gr2]|uniref:hypothetical protein n=1 Tax=unclassified Leptolyngbya TaxID=2650499 RepID=UPI003D31B158